MKGKADFYHFFSPAGELSVTTPNGPEVQSEEPGFIPSSAPLQIGPAETVHSAFLGPEGLRPGWGLALYFGLGAVIFFILISIDRLIPQRGASALWQQLVTYVALVFASLGSAVIMSRIEKRAFGGYGLPAGRLAIKNFLVGLFWGIAALSVLMLAMYAVGVFSLDRLVLHGIRMLKFAGFWGVVFLLVGLFEEFTFRGYALHNLTRAMGFWPAAIMLSIGFGALHLANPGEAWIGAIAAGFIGLFFCFTVRRTGSLWFAVGMHASWDWGESYLYSVPDSGGVVTGHLVHSSVHGSRWLSGGSIGPEGSLLVFVVVSLAWFIFDRSYKVAQYDPT